MYASSLRSVQTFSPVSGERQGWRGGKGHDGHTGMIYNRRSEKAKVPEDRGLIGQALIDLKPVNAWVHTYTKPQTSSTRSRGLGWRIHESVEDTKLSTNKQHSLSMTSGGRVHGRRCDAFQHGWFRPCWTARSLQENWQIPKYFLLNWSSSTQIRRVCTTGEHCAYLVSSLKCALTCIVAGNQEQRGIARSYLQVTGCGGAAPIQVRALTRGSVRSLIP